MTGTTGVRKIILDTDPGVGIPGTDADDPIALMLALADPRLELLGVTTTFGNCPPDLAARCASAVLRAAGREDVPVAAGAGVPLGGTLPELLLRAYEGDRGRPGRIELPALADAVVDDDAAGLITRLVRSHPGEVTIVAIGPQTNIATALRADESLADDVGSIVFMGGALGLDPEFGRGNVTPVAECNMWFDPDAAATVMAAGIPLTMVSLDVTNPNKGVVLTDEMLRTVDPNSSRIAPLFLEVCRTYLEAPMFDWAGHGGCVLYDPLAIAVAADPDVATFEPMAIDVETAGRLTLGQTVPLRETTPNVSVCTDVDGPTVVQAMVDTILSL